MVLGAERGAVLKMVLGEGLKLSLAGVAVGMIGAVALTRFLRDQLFEVTAVDPVTFAGVPLLLTLVALAACYLPARRAVRVDPVVALRHE